MVSSWLHIPSTVSNHKYVFPPRWKVWNPGQMPGMDLCRRSWDFSKCLLKVNVFFFRKWLHLKNLEMHYIGVFWRTPKPLSLSAWCWEKKQLIVKLVFVLQTIYLYSSIMCYMQIVKLQVTTVVTKIYWVIIQSIASCNEWSVAVKLEWTFREKKIEIKAFSFLQKGSNQITGSIRQTIHYGYHWPRRRKFSHLWSYFLCMRLLYTITYCMILSASCVKPKFIQLLCP